MEQSAYSHQSCSFSAKVHLQAIGLKEKVEPLTKDSGSQLVYKPHVHGSPATCYSDQQQHQSHDRPIAAAANARPAPRPSECNRIFVEFCCDPGSKLGQSRHASRGCHVTRVTKQQDATKMTNIRKLVRQIHQLCDEGGEIIQQKNRSFGRHFPAQVGAATGAY